MQSTKDIFIFKSITLIYQTINHKNQYSPTKTVHIVTCTKTNGDLKLEMEMKMKPSNPKFSSSSVT